MSRRCWLYVTVAAETTTTTTTTTTSWLELVDSGPPQQLPGAQRWQGHRDMSLRTLILLRLLVKPYESAAQSVVKPIGLCAPAGSGTFRQTSTLDREKSRRRLLCSQLALQMKTSLVDGANSKKRTAEFVRSLLIQLACVGRKMISQPPAPPAKLALLCDIRRQVQGPLLDRTGSGSILCSSPFLS